MTAAELYEVDSDFRSLIAEWIRVKRCPYGMGDYLDERDLPGPAVAARWAATEPDRREWVPDQPSYKKIGIFPGSMPGNNRWFWWYRGEEWKHPKDNNDIPFSTGTTPRHLTVEDALLWLLDHPYWKK